MFACIYIDTYVWMCVYSHTYGIYKNTVPKLYLYVYMCPLELSCDLKICTKNMLGNVYKVSKQIQDKAGAQILGLLSPDLLSFSSECLLLR